MTVCCGGRLTSTVYPNGVTQATRYNASGAEAATEVTTGVAPSTQILGSWSNVRNAAGDITAIDHTMVDAAGGSTASSGVATYTYDNLYQLRSEHDTAPQTVNDTYAFSVAGDPTKLGSVSQSFNAAHELCWTKTGAAPGATCTAPPPVASQYGYNSAGDRTTSAGATIGYHNRGPMTAAGSASYTYDPDGLRVSKTVAGATTNFVWDDSTAIPLLRVDGASRYVYGPDGIPIERLGNAKADTRWLGHDTQHSITLATDNSADVTTTNTYTPWGATRSHTGEAMNLGYGSQYTDPETGPIYLRARYYDPETAQFVSCDPLGAATGRRYGYTYNNPVNASDPSGLSTCGQPHSIWDNIGAAIDCASHSDDLLSSLTHEVKALHSRMERAACQIVVRRDTCEDSGAVNAVRHFIGSGVIAHLALQSLGPTFGMAATFAILQGHEIQNCFGNDWSGRDTRADEWNNIVGVTFGMSTLGMSLDRTFSYMENNARFFNTHKVILDFGG